MVAEAVAVMEADQVKEVAINQEAMAEAGAEAMAVNQMREEVATRAAEVKCTMHQKGLPTGDDGKSF